jgi:hypothetical protein
LTFQLDDLLYAFIMKKIFLTQNQYALVDDEDYDFLIQWNWYAHRSDEKYTYYAMRTVQKKEIRMHNAIAEKYKISDYDELDHIDRNGLNNQKENLRISTRGENNFNRRNWGVMPKGIRLNKSTYKKRNGEIKEYITYQARINVKGKSIFLGNHKELTKAIDAYAKASKKYYPNCV